jgi:glutamyl-Q tRNA(Asp) synthetase
MQPIGRFAPSPTGPLHFGSLVAAVASYADVRSAGGRWLLRLEDLDPLRTVPGAADDILRTLEAFGFEWHGAVMAQSTRSAAYAAALARLQGAGAVYACSCSRKELGDAALAAADGALVYPGTCRAGLPPGRTARAMRVRVGTGTLGCDDAVQGFISQQLEREVGDFVVKRADGYYAYQLAVVVDDAEQGVTDVVRGADLLDSTPRQILLQQLLGVPTPRFMHVPVATDEAGMKLSKQTRAARIDRSEPLRALRHALAFLGQTTPEAASLDELWQHTFARWDRARIPRRRASPVLG